MRTHTATRKHTRVLLSRRLDAGLSQAQQAAEIGVTARVYGYAEAGGTPSPPNIARFSTYYAVPAVDLFYPEMKEAA